MGLCNLLIQVVSLFLYRILIYTMNKFLYCFTSVLFLINSASAQKGTVDWITIEEAIERSKTENKKIVVDIHTEWCTYCIKMEKNTFQEEHISKYLNENFLPVKFDAEQKTDINFQGETYQYVKSFKRGYHELAAHLTNGKLSFPTVVFLDENLNIIQAIAGYQDVKTFEMIMAFYGDDFHHHTPWQKFVRNYISPFRPMIRPGIEIQPARIGRQ